MRFAAVASDGTVVARYRRTTPIGLGLDAMCTAIIGGYEKVRRDSNCRKPFAVAAAVPTASCGLDGRLSKLPNIPILNDFELGTFLSDAFRTDVFVLNDASAATVGEHWLGASRGYENVIGVTLGTGVGGGLIINGTPFTGKDGSAGEIGHICVVPEGRACGCGANGCLEQYSSGSAIVQMAEESGLVVKNAKEVFDLASSGDERSQSVIELAGRHLGIAFSGLVNTLNPDLIVIGGGVSGGFARLLPSIKNEISVRAFPVPAQRVNIVRAKLGDKAGVLGAARLAFLSSLGS